MNKNSLTRDSTEKKIKEEVKEDSKTIPYHLIHVHIEVEEALLTVVEEVDLKVVIVDMVEEREVLMILI